MSPTASTSGLPDESERISPSVKADPPRVILAPGAARKRATSACRIRLPTLAGAPAGNKMSLDGSLPSRDSPWCSQCSPTTLSQPSSAFKSATRRWRKRSISDRYASSARVLGTWMLRAEANRATRRNPLCGSTAALRCKQATQVLSARDETADQIILTAPGSRGRNEKHLAWLIASSGCDVERRGQVQWRFARKVGMNPEHATKVAAGAAFLRLVGHRQHVHRLTRCVWRSD